MLSGRIVWAAASLVWVLVVICCSSAEAQVAGSSGSIWEPAVLAQPFDRQPFQPIRIPAWVQQTVGCGYTLSGMDTAARTAAAQHGVTISEVNFVDPFYPYYDSKLLARRSPHVPADRLAKDLAEYKKLGVRVLAVYPPCLQGEVYEQHPEWRRIDTNTTVIPSVDLAKFPHGGMLCLLGPYGDFFIDVLAEIVTQYPQVDAFSFDGLHYGGVCYCESCRTAYREQTKSEIPALDMNDPAFRRYQHWADRRMEDLIRRMQTRLKGIKPDVALVTWTTNAGRWGHFLSIPRNMPARMNLLLDAPDQEFWLDETNRGATIVPAFANAAIWGMTNHRVAFSEPYLMSHGNPYGKDSFPPHEIEQRMMLALTYGASPSIAVAQPTRMQQPLYDCLDQVQRRKPWLTHKQPEPWAALVLSDNTRNFYGRSAGLVEERYMASVLGAFRAAVETHLPVAVVNDWNLTEADLTKYRVLILPNTACLDDAQAKAIDQYVRNGGGLVASLDTSLFNEFGDPRENFALAETLGVDYRSLPSAPMADPAAPAVDPNIDVNFAKSIDANYWEKRKDVFEYQAAPDSPLHQGRLQTYVGPEPVTFKGPAVGVAVRDGSSQTLGQIYVKDAAPAVRMPAVVARQHGKGRVVYLAAGFDAGYYLYAYPYQRLILQQAIEWAAISPPPVQVAAPMCVHATVMRQDLKGERLVVHLYNDVNTTAHHAKPDDDVPLREETLPIHDVQVTFDSSYSLGQIHLEPEGIELTKTPTPSGVVVKIPQLDIHAMVVAELLDVQPADADN